MLQYWINRDGQQQGPYSYDELKNVEIDAGTWVWCSGMDDWKKIVDVPELASLAKRSAEAAPEPAAAEPQTVHDSGGVAAETEVAEPATDAAEYAETAAAEQAEPPAYTGLEQQYCDFTGQQSIPGCQQPQYAAVAQEAPECPPTNLVWAIIATILCCMPLGVVAIVMAAMVRSKYDAGNYKAAQKYSDWSAWLCIASITLGVIGMPLSVLALL